MLLVGTTASARRRSWRSPYSARANRFFARSAHSAGGLASGGDRGERARAEELRRVPSRERERIVSNAARIGEQGDEAFEQLFVLEFFGVDPVAVLGQQLRQRLCLDEPVLFVTWHRLVCTRNAVVSRVPRPGQAVPVRLLL